MQLTFLKAIILAFKRLVHDLDMKEIEYWKYDSFLVLIRYHTLRGQSFDTDWMKNVSVKELNQIVITLQTYGYITCLKKGFGSYYCKLTSKGMEFCQKGGFKELQKQKTKNRQKQLCKITLAIISLISAILAIIEFFSR